MKILSWTWRQETPPPRPSWTSWCTRPWPPSTLSCMTWRRIKVSLLPSWEAAETKCKTKNLQNWQKPQFQSLSSHHPYKHCPDSYTYEPVSVCCLSLNYPRPTLPSCSLVLAPFQKKVSFLVARRHFQVAASTIPGRVCQVCDVEGMWGIQDEHCMTTWRNTLLGNIFLSPSQHNKQYTLQRGSCLKNVFWYLKNIFLNIQKLSQKIHS